MTIIMLVCLASRKINIRRNGSMLLSIPRSFFVNIKAEQGKGFADVSRRQKSNAYC